jgi:hypothetical protein
VLFSLRALLGQRQIREAALQPAVAAESRSPSGRSFWKATLYASYEHR